jgi:hypothetical protein
MRATSKTPASADRVADPTSEMNASDEAGAEGARQELRVITVPRPNRSRRLRRARAATR